MHMLEIENTLELLEETDHQIGDDMENEEEVIMKGRNSRKPKKANHGARPCSSYMRKLKKTGWVNKLGGNAD